METEIKLNERLRLTESTAFASLTMKEGSSLSLDEIWKTRDSWPQISSRPTWSKSWNVTECHPFRSERHFGFQCPLIKAHSLGWESTLNPVSCCTFSWLLIWWASRHFVTGHSWFRFCEMPMLFLIFLLSYFLIYSHSLYPLIANLLSVLCVANIFSQFSGLSFILWTPAYLC